MPEATRSRKPPDQRQRELLAAALERFAADGFDGASVQHIAERAGVAAGTVYLYFPSKEHLLLGLQTQFHEGLSRVFTEVTTEWRERADRGEAIDLAVASDRVVDALVDYSVAHREHCVVLTTYLPRLADSAEAQAIRGGIAEQLGGVLEDAAERGLTDLEHPRIAARLLATATIQTIGPAVADGDPDELAQLTAQTKQLYRKALAPGT